MPVTLENPTLPTIPFLISTRELAALVGVKPETVSQWRFREVGPAYLTLDTGVGRTVRYELAEVQRWLAQRNDPSSGQE